jgi:chorismate mutase/prephenate dehydratase
MKRISREDLHDELKQMRGEIDRIDRKLLTLLNDRLRVALNVGKIKKKMGEKIYHPEREKEVLRRLGLKNRGPLEGKDLEKIFGTIMRVSRRSQIKQGGRKRSRNPSLLR